MAGAEPDREEAGEVDEALDLAEAGADLAGALAGGAVGLVGGPAGALGGAALGVIVQRGARAVVGRFRSRERERAGAALVLIADDAREREARRERPRDDGFFDDRGGLRPEGIEVLEGVLMQAANAYEERKLPLLAQLYSAVAHDPAVRAADAHYLVRVAGELTHRQFVALGVFANREAHYREIVRAEGDREVGRSRPSSALLLELDDLADRRLLGVEMSGTVRTLTSMTGSVGVPRAGQWSNLALTDRGAELARLTGADRLPAEERRAWVAALHSPEVPNEVPNWENLR